MHDATAKVLSQLQASIVTSPTREGNATASHSWGHGEKKREQRRAQKDTHSHRRHSRVTDNTEACRLKPKPIPHDTSSCNTYWKQYFVTSAHPPAKGGGRRPLCGTSTCFPVTKPASGTRGLTWESTAASAAAPAGAWRRPRGGGGQSGLPQTRPAPGASSQPPGAPPPPRSAAGASAAAGQGLALAGALGARSGPAARGRGGGRAPCGGGGHGRARGPGAAPRDRRAPVSGRPRGAVRHVGDARGRAAPPPPRAGGRRASPPPGGSRAGPRLPPAHRRAARRSPQQDRRGRAKAPVCRAVGQGAAAPVTPHGPSPRPTPSGVRPGVGVGTGQPRDPAAGRCGSGCLGGERGSRRRPQPTPGPPGAAIAGLQPRPTAAPPRPALSGGRPRPPPPIVCAGAAPRPRPAPRRAPPRAVTSPSAAVFAARAPRSAGAGNAVQPVRGPVRPSLGARGNARPQRGGRRRAAALTALRAK